MKMHKQTPRGATAWVTLLVIGVGLVPIPALAYLRMSPPPDVDKSSSVQGVDNSCWEATAANMLAGAGYGTGRTAQLRADQIYGQMRP